MRLKSEEIVRLDHSLKENINKVGKWVSKKRNKLVILSLVLIIVFFIGLLFGLLFIGFFGTLDSPSPRAIELLHIFEINNMRELKFKFIDNILAENIKIPFNYLKGKFSSPEKISIEISFKDYQKLAYIREQALKVGILSSSYKEDDNFVPAVINYGNKKIDVELRLKGDATDHLDTNKWSFRVNVKGGETLFGMRTFNLQHPKTRGYIYGWFVNAALDKEGIITPRYDFIDVTINGKHEGVYALEENFDKILIENNRFREGPIIKFNEDLIWEKYIRGELFKEILPDSYYTLEIDSFQTSKVMEDEMKFEQYIKAKDLLESFREGKLKAHEVFDINKLSKYIVFIDLMGGYFGLSYNNMRFYYNPITSLLEPIANGLDYPTDIYTIAYYYDNDGWYPFRDSLFKDEKFKEIYFEELRRVSKDEYLDNLFSSLDQELKEKMNIIHSEYPYIHFSKEIFYKNQRFIQNFLSPIKGLQAYINSFKNDNPILEIANIQGLPINILSIEHENKTYQLVNQNDYLEGKSPKKGLTYELFEFEEIPGISSKKLSEISLKLNYNLLGDTNIIKGDVFPWSHLSEDFLYNDFIRRGSNINDFEFLDVNVGDQKILIKKGDWIIDQDVIIPSGFTVYCNEGTNINLIKDSMILSYSPFEFLGLENSPITISSSDNTGQGLTLLNAKEDSNFEYVYFKNLINPSKEGWTLTGAINFYESPVNLKNVIIEGMNSEDSINIIKTKYSMNKVVIKDGASDCMDNDFCIGNIESIYVSNCVNDGLDFSGSEVHINNVELTNLGDKAISAGEKSNITINNAYIHGNYVGIAGKDLSVIYINNTKILKNKYGITAYQKKPEFGPSYIKGENIDLQNDEFNSFIEENSKLILDDKEIKGEEKNVYDTFCGEGRC